MKQVFHFVFTVLWVCAVLYLITVAMDLLNTKNTAANFVGFLIIITLVSVTTYIIVKSLKK